MIGDIVSAPLAVVDAIWQQAQHDAQKQGNTASAEDIATSCIHERFRKLAADQNTYRTIPELDTTTINSNIVQNNQLVRYKGLVQDVFDIEYFVGVRHNPPVGGAQGSVSYLKYRDSSGGEGSFGSGGEDVAMERLPLYCIPLPGECDWSQGHSRLSRDTESCGDSRKRPADEHSDYAACNAGAVSNKAHRAEINEFDTAAGLMLPPAVPAVLATAVQGAQPPVPPPTDSVERSSNCLVKMYDFRDTASYGNKDDDSYSMVKLNDMIEIIGIYNTYIEPLSAGTAEQSADPSAMSMAMISGDPFFGFEGTENVPSKLINVPTVHCVVFRKLCSAYPLYRTMQHTGSHSSGMSSGYELIPYGNSFAEKTVTTINDPCLAPHNVCYDSVVKLFTNALGGDVVSASYLALTVISGLTSRAPGDVALGSLTLNIHGLQPNDCRVASIASAVRQVLPRVVQAQLDRDSLAKPEEGGHRFFAERNATTESIDRSSLQLGAGTALFIDETKMTEGPVSQNALRSMKALESVVKSQLLPVDFEYCHGIKIPTDICVIILSNSPSIIGDTVIRCFSPTDMFPVNASSPYVGNRLTASAGDAHNNTGGDMDVVTCGGDHQDSLLHLGQDINALREWWARCRLSDASLEESMITHVEEDFVNARQGKAHQPATTTAGATTGTSDAQPTVPYPIEGSDFHNWLTLSRLQAMADGSPVILATHWSRIRLLEAERYHNKVRFKAQLSAVLQ